MELFELFSKYVKQSRILSDKEIEEIYSCFETEHITKNQFFLQAGNRCSKIGFLYSGILCSFMYNTEGDEVVKHFLEPHQFLTDLESFEKAQLTRLNMVTVTDALTLSN
jgi:hypothetical protein